jgi:hypothetical protein
LNKFSKSTHKRRIFSPVHTPPPYVQSSPHIHTPPPYVQSTPHINTLYLIQSTYIPSRPETKVTVNIPYNIRLHSHTGLRQDIKRNLLPFRLLTKITNYFLF